MTSATIILLAVGAACVSAQTFNVLLGNLTTYQTPATINVNATENNLNDADGFHFIVRAAANFQTVWSYGGVSTGAGPCLGSSGTAGQCLLGFSACAMYANGGVATATITKRPANGQPIAVDVDLRDFRPVPIVAATVPATYDTVGGAPLAYSVDVADVPTTVWISSSNFTGQNPPRLLVRQGDRAAGLPTCFDLDCNATDAATGCSVNLTATGPWHFTVYGLGDADAAHIELTSDKPSTSGTTGSVTTGTTGGSAAVTAQLTGSLTGSPATTGTTGSAPPATSGTTGVAVATTQSTTGAPATNSLSGSTTQAQSTTSSTTSSTTTTTTTSSTTAATSTSSTTGDSSTTKVSLLVCTLAVALVAICIS